MGVFRQSVGKSGLQNTVLFLEDEAQNKFIKTAV
jgi:hypothetical protein